MKRRKLNKRGKFLLFILALLVILLIFLIIKPKDKKEIKKDKPVNKINQVEKKEENNSETDYNLREGEEIIGKSDKDFIITKLNDVYYIDGVLIVNKTYPLPSSYKPIKPYKEITKDYLYGGDYIEDYVMEAYLKMKEDANKEGIDCEGMGSKTKLYFYTNALIREFVANIVQEKRSHIIIILMINISLIVLIGIGYYYNFLYMM